MKKNKTSKEVMNGIKNKMVKTYRTNENRIKEVNDSLDEKINNRKRGKNNGN